MFKDTSWLVGLTFIQRLSGLLTTIILVRLLSKEAYGDYNFVLNILSIITIFSLPGMKNAVMQSVSRGFSGTYLASLRPALLYSCLGSIVLSILAIWYYLQSRADLSLAFLISGLLFPAAYGLDHWKGYFLGKKKFDKLTQYDGAASVLTAIGIIAILFVFPGTILVPLTVMLLALSIQNIFLFFTIKGVTQDKTVEDGSIKYGIKISFYMVFSRLALTIDKILIFFFLSPQSLAVYAVAEKFPELTKNIIKNVVGALLPHFAQQKNYTRKVDKALKLFSIFLFFTIIIFTFTLFPPVLILLFGEDYAEMVPYSQALMCITALMNAALLRAGFIKSKLDERSFRDFTIYMAIIRILAAVFLVIPFGLAGAVIANLIGRIANHLIVLIIMKKRYPIR